MEQATAKPKTIQHTLDEEIAELQREIGLRHGVYPKFVASGKMQQMDADYQISVLYSAINRLKALRYLTSQISNPF